MKVVGEQIRKFREMRGMSQEELASKLGISRSYLSRIEKGHKAANLERLQEISEVLKVDLSEFFPEKKYAISENTEEDNRWAYVIPELEKKGLGPDEILDLAEIAERLIKKQKE